MSIIWAWPHIMDWSSFVAVPIAESDELKEGMSGTTKNNISIQTKLFRKIFILKPPIGFVNKCKNDSWSQTKFVLLTNI